MMEVLATPRLNFLFSCNDVSTYRLDSSVVQEQIPFRVKGAIARRSHWAIAMSVVLGVLGILSPVIAMGSGPQSSDSWQELGLLNIGRWGCKAHAIDGYRALVFTGQGDEIGLADSSAEILDTNTGQWTLTSLMPAGFAPGTIAWTAGLKDGYFLVTGGSNALKTGDLRSYIYSVSSNQWIRTGDLPTGSTVASNRSQTNSVVLADGRVLIAGGLTIGVGESNASVVFTPNYTNLGLGASGDAVGTWDFTRNRQGKVTTLNGASEHHKHIRLEDGRVLLVHGNDHRYAIPRDYLYRDTHGVQAELFDPKSGIWTALPNLPAIVGEDDRHNGVKGVRQQAALALLGDGRVLVSGGRSSPADSRGKPLLKDVFYVRSSAILFDPKRFDLGTYPWSITGPMNVARDSHSMGNLAGSAGIISAWGWTDSEWTWTATAEVYDPAQGAWHFVAGLPALPGTDLAISLPWGCSAMMPAGRMLIIGGIADAELGVTSRHTYLYKP